MIFTVVNKASDEDTVISLTKNAEYVKKNNNKKTKTFSRIRSSNYAQEGISAFT